MPRLRDILSATFSEGSIADNLRKRQDEQRVLDEAVRKRVRLPKRFFGAEEEGDFEFESGKDAAAALTSVMKRPESQRRVKVRLSEIDNRVPATPNVAGTTTKSSRRKKTPRKRLRWRSLANNFRQRRSYQLPKAHQWLGCCHPSYQLLRKTKICSDHLKDAPER